MSENSFWNRNGLTQRTVRAAGRHAKWTGSSMLNNIINVMIAFVVLVGYNTISGNEGGIRLITEREVGRFVSHDAENHTAILNCEGVEREFRCTDGTWVDCADFTRCSDNVADYLNRAVAMSQHNGGNPTPEQLASFEPSDRIVRYYPANLVRNG